MSPQRHAQTLASMPTHRRAKFDHRRTYTRLKPRSFLRIAHPQSLQCVPSLKRKDALAFAHQPPIPTSTATGGLFRAVNVLWQNRKQPSHRAKEVTRKSYFCPVPRQSDVRLSQRQRGHAEIILCHTAICHARARPPRHTPSATTIIAIHVLKPARFPIFCTPST